MEFKKYSKEEFVKELTKDLPDKIDLSYLSMDEDFEEYTKEDSLEILDKKRELTSDLIDMLDDLKNTGLYKELRGLRNSIRIKHNNRRNCYIATQESLIKKNESKRQEQIHTLEEEVGAESVQVDDNFLLTNCEVCEKHFGKKPQEICALKGDQTTDECMRLFAHNEEVQEKMDSVWIEDERRFVSWKQH